MKLLHRSQRVAKVPSDLAFHLIILKLRKSFARSELFLFLSHRFQTGLDVCEELREGAGSFILNKSCLWCEI